MPTTEPNDAPPRPAPLQPEQDDAEAGSDRTCAAGHPADDPTDGDDPLSSSSPGLSPGPSPVQGSTGWLGRIRGALGLSPANTLRDDLEAELERDDDDALATAFSPGERTLLRNILELEETRVADVMIPRADICAVEESMTIADVMKVYQAIGHTRMPVHNGELDDAVGMVHIKDVMGWLVARAARTGGFDLAAVDLSTTLAASGIVRKTLDVPAEMPAAELLQRMQATHIQMALVVDEYGGIDGLVSLEDLVEIIVGEIDDEHDEDTGPEMLANGKGVFIADARVPLEEVVEQLGPRFAVDSDAEAVDTIGGFVVGLIGRVPARGEFFRFDKVPDFVFEVLDADQRRIKRLQIFGPEAAEAAEERRRWRGAAAVAARS